MTLELQATPQEVMRAVEALQAFGKKQGIGERDLFGLALALEECASNIVNHALQRDARQKFQFSFEYTPSAMTLELRDRGPEFDPTRIEVGHTSGEQDRPAGGWGIELVRHYMDEFRYRREAGENVLRLTKRLGPPIPRGSKPDTTN